MLSPNDMHIHSLVLTFNDADNVTAKWSAYADGKPTEHGPAFNYSRVKDAEAATKIVNSTLSCCATASTAECKLGEGAEKVAEKK